MDLVVVGFKYIKFDIVNLANLIIFAIGFTLKQKQKWTLLF